MRLMFRLVTMAGLLMLLGVASSSWAKDPKPFAQTAEVNKPMEQVFAALREYFGGMNLHNFQLVKADKKTGTLVAKRSGIDQRTWGEWAYCKVSPTNLLDSLEDGTVTVNVKLESDALKKTYVSVTPYFEGEYSPLTSSETLKVKCESQGILEKDILTAAGALPEQID